MYRMSNSEFLQYESAERHYEEIRLRHVYDLKQAYNGICPTITRFNCDEGSIYSESVNPEDYAIYLIELQEEHKRQEKWWKLRAEAYKEAYGKLNLDEQLRLNSLGFEIYNQREETRKKLRRILTEIVENRPELQRQRQINTSSVLEDMEEADQQIEKMSMKELLTDYKNFMDQEQEERLKKQCIYLYQACDWPFSMIGKRLGIPTARVKEYVNSNEEKKPTKKQFGAKEVNNIEITYLSPDELEEYRSGKKGGSKWCSYDEYLRFRADGMTKSEIAIKLRIELNELSYRIRFWKLSELNRHQMQS